MSESVKLGYKTLSSGNEACAYFKTIMQQSPRNTNLNEVRESALSQLSEALLGGICEARRFGGLHGMD